MNRDNKSIKKDLPISEGIPESGNNELNSIEGISLKNLKQLRNEVLDQVSIYCSQLSNTLLMEFDESIVDQVKELRIDIDVSERFLAMKKKLEEDDRIIVGHEILKELREMINAKA
ncbi:hypothetical protein GYB22_06570 [bacterium]|nr:hypothetical protein [bacterium]